ncbi:hypothetical protein GO491_07735, partial [Flavobacteriaceae bacterium Ap0902]|nr:hypothetical protein [Flavobacteriaceae bacterium Ap0902]
MKNNYLILFIPLISGIMFSQELNLSPDLLIEQNAIAKNSNNSIFNRVTCDTAIETIRDDFESYVAGAGEDMPTCWTSAGSFVAAGVRNSDGNAYSGSNYVLGYTLFTANGFGYFITPNLSTINNLYQGQFYVRGAGSDGSAINFEYGTMSDNSDVSTFVSFGSPQVTNPEEYELYTTPVGPNNSGEYFALRFEIETWHTAIYLDDFEWIPIDTD